MELKDLFDTLVVFFGFSLSLVLMFLSIKIFSANKTDYHFNMESSGHILDPLKGNLVTFKEDKRMYRVQAGLAVNKNNSWVEQGALSNEAINTVLK